LLQDRPVRGEGGWSRLLIKRHGLANSGMPSQRNIFLGCAGIELVAP
jgi:hypothetical protein